MSDTPRTDAAEPQIATIGSKWVRAEFARELKRELMEQARLNGMGSEREASMLAQIEVLQRENARLKQAAYEAMHMADDLAQCRKECARLQMELDSTCNAEELRQVRAENAALREDKARLDWLAEQHRRERQSMSASDVLTNDTTETVILIVFDEHLRAGFSEGATFRDAIDAARKEAKP